MPRNVLAAAIEDGGGAAADDARQREADSLSALRRRVALVAKEEHELLNPSKTGMTTTWVSPRVLSYGEVLRLGSLCLSSIQDREQLVGPPGAASGAGFSASVPSQGAKPSYSGIGPDTPVTCLEDDTAAKCRLLLAQSIRSAGHPLAVVSQSQSDGASKLPQSPEIVPVGSDPMVPAGTSPSLARSQSSAASSSDLSSPPLVRRSSSVAELVRTSSTGSTAPTADASRSMLGATSMVIPADGAVPVPINQLRLHPTGEDDAPFPWDPRLK